MIGGQSNPGKGREAAPTKPPCQTVWHCCGPPFLFSPASAPKLGELPRTELCMYLSSQHVSPVEPVHRDCAALRLRSFIPPEFFPLPFSLLSQSLLPPLRLQARACGPVVEVQRRVHSDSRPSSCPHGPPPSSVVSLSLGQYPGTCMSLSPVLGQSTGAFTRQGKTTRNLPCLANSPHTSRVSLPLQQSPPCRSLRGVAGAQEDWLCWPPSSCPTGLFQVNSMLNGVATTSISQTTVLLRRFTKHSGTAHWS